MKLPHITITTSRVLQSILMVGHVLNAVLPLATTVQEKAWVAAGIGACNVLVSDMAHYSTPAGGAIPSSTQSA